MPEEPSKSIFSFVKNLLKPSNTDNQINKNIEPEDERIEELIENVLNIRDSIVKEIMIPKVNISYIKESDVQKMSAKEYERKSDSIMEAIRSGKFIYDVSGSAR